MHNFSLKKQTVMFKDVTVKSQKLRFLTKSLFCNFMQLFDFYFLTLVNSNPNKSFCRDIFKRILNSFAH